MHLDEDLLERILRRELPAEMLWAVVHPHLLAACAPCRVEWEACALGDEGRRLSPRRASETLPVRRLHWSVRGLERRRRVLSRVRALRRRAREDVKALLELAPQRRRGRIERARSRFRTRAVAELLLCESRRLVRTAPGEAASLARLVPEVLHWTPGAPGSRWAAALALRAAAHEANALRVGGDLPAADCRFATLRRDLVRQPVEDVGALAEACSLEASLRIGQRRTRAAEALLHRAALLYRHAGDVAGEARVLIQGANLAQSDGRADDALHRLREAARRLRPDEQPYLVLCTVAGRLNALCDLERFEEAAMLLEEYEELRQANDDLHLRATLLLLEGRVATGSGDLGAAETALVASRRAFARAQRGYDAAIAALYLAEVYLRARRARDLRHLAAELIAEFRARGVERETLAALRLFANAATTEEATLRQLHEARSRLERSHHLRSKRA